ncbi:MAG: hypothetical protein QS748_13830 [Candidatus Endonucleobacter bathymodioli]|uniref:Uncharacterized protein n=1 Tax=Candidatus Endonucleibacter bathymodioli TaxID=539814 RepID=A0AA90NNQ4_9GAMM|nr:hypothetical protein [Candidatus Endonucleobacter bathymodioli]
MSKYEYTTVYEEFTGLKPPEPKTIKPKRRRGHGHPYRMRVNMQDLDQQTPSVDCETTDTPKALFQSSTHQTQPAFHNNIKSLPLLHENTEHSPQSPTVKYKKRRIYTPDHVHTDTFE